MNILFLLKGLEMGGVEVVTAVLAQKFKNEGHDVTIFALDKHHGSALTRFPKDIEVKVGVGINSSDSNVSLLREVLITKKIEVVINQWALPYAPIKTVTRARKGLNVKVISVYHNDPLNNGRIQSVDMTLENTTNPAKRVLLKFKRKIYAWVTSRCMSYTYNHSDLFMVLSPGFVDNFINFTGIRNSDHLVVQTNPMTLNEFPKEIELETKNKEILFVGRLDNNQKRVNRVIETWALLENDYSDWKLTLVGDGEDRLEVENLIRTKGLKNVYIEGFKNPTEYYKRSSILVLTSEYEGFGLVIVEGMTYGVVPVVYDSYVALHDIVKGNVNNGNQLGGFRNNGVIVPKCQGRFSATTMADYLRVLMDSDAMRKEMSQAAIETSKEYSIDTIYEQWVKVLNNINVKS